MGVGDGTRVDSELEFGPWLRSTKNQAIAEAEDCDQRDLIRT